VRPGRGDNAFDATALALEDREIALGGEGDALHDRAVHVRRIVTAGQAEELATCVGRPAEPLAVEIGQEQQPVRAGGNAVAIAAIAS